MGVSGERRRVADARRRVSHSDGGFDAGIVISASHNPFEDNGIKIFSGRGEKLDEAFERRIEAMVADPSMIVSEAKGSPSNDPRSIDEYVAHLRQILSAAGPLAGSRIVIDCAQWRDVADRAGAVPELGFDVVAIGDAPNGRNINLDCGSTHLAGLQRKVVETSARLGVAFDGDGDRALFVDRHGATVDGDAVLLVAAEQLQREGRLPGDAIVATVMSNIGLELALKDRGIELVRAPVGDKYVMEEMIARSSRSAASSPATSSLPIICSPAMASAPRCRCFGSWQRRVVSSTIWRERS